MKWRLKAFAKWVLSQLPAGGRINYWLQRTVTRTLPVPDEKLLDRAVRARRLARRYAELSEVPVEKTTLYEVGGGWDLADNIVLACQGIAGQIVTDVEPLLKPELVNDAIVRIASLADQGEIRLKWRPPSAVSENFEEALQDLRDRYRIDYKAPIDARDTGPESGSVDCAFSINTFEHIPRDEVEPVAAECGRVLRPGGLALFRIDYKDHYSYVDPSVSVYNFLRYEQGKWERLYNPPLHRQNRLRHRDYLRIFSELDLEPVEVDTELAEPAQVDALRSIDLAEEFRVYSESELEVLSATIILRRKG